MLNTIPGISFVTAATIISVVDEIQRFERAGQFSSYCGLVPSEHSSGEKIYRGRITKEGVKEPYFAKINLYVKITEPNIFSKGDKNAKKIKNWTSQRKFTGVYL